MVYMNTDLDNIQRSVIQRVSGSFHNKAPGGFLKMWSEFIHPCRSMTEKLPDRFHVGDKACQLSMGSRAKRTHNNL